MKGLTPIERENERKRGREIKRKEKEREKREEREKNKRGANIQLETRKSSNKISTLFSKTRTADGQTCRF